MLNPLLSDDPNTIASSLKQAIRLDKNSPTKKTAREGMRYYDHENDILKNRIFYIDDDNELREDKYASNTKIPHGFFPEIVDQKTQVLLSNPLTFDCEDDSLKQELETYYDEDFQVFLQDTVTSASQKGYEYIFARTTAEDRLTFQIADSLTVFPVYDDTNQLKRIVRNIDKDIVKNGRKLIIHLAEVWDDKQVWFFKAEGTKNYQLNTDITLNPRPHVVAVRDDGSLLRRDYGVIPFYRYKNNAKETNDLKPIKALIDDYDIMNAFLSNNLQDFTEAIYVVKGYDGDDLSKLRQNIRAKKTVGVDADGGVEIQTVNIPVEGRKTKMEIDKANIYKFGMAFDSTQIGDGNITNVVIKSRYSLLNMKVNKTEVRIRALLKWINQMVVADINRRKNTAYDPADVSFEFTRELMVNETDIAANKKTAAETKQVMIATILEAAPQLPDDEILRLICEQFDLDFDEIKDELEEEPYTQGLASGTDREVINDATVGQVATGTGEVDPETVQKD
ncbi:portal protein [Lapidilactobacillus dextrinicus DSM 20335]|uniref:Portal protein n=1 Tax=Lapidilactobacillus dextrinicus DSM 20335 TaxID=1423738 RepID=A0A0R2BJS7_9LACO|nr:phage portal protein [Lapidilactobacillus dextrinicus]KRM79482.1 portal protein [Lapidilactobacillus dextrinicus DSM 20335]QFG46683.1 phage portal protein [Lapidilactobacillus dextrinicus]